MKDTALGFRLLQADSLLLSSSSRYIQKITIDGQVSSFPGEKNTEIQPINKLQYEDYDSKRKKMFNECKKKHNSLEFRAWILTDVNEDYTFSIKDGSIIFTSTPYFYIWGVEKELITSNYEIPVEFCSCTQSFKKFRSETALIAPSVWSAAIHTARFSALIRFLNNQFPSTIKKLQMAINKSHRSISVGVFI